MRTYLNAFINWPGYEAFTTYRPEWTLRTADGEIVKHTSGTPRPDPSNAAFREWWSDVIANEMKRGPIDGVFVDALPQALTPALTKAVGSEKVRAVAAGLREMIALTKRKMGVDKILLANGTRTTDFREITNGTSPMPRCLLTSKQKKGPDRLEAMKHVPPTIVAPLRVFEPGNVGEADKILPVCRECCDGGTLHGDGGAFGFAHGCGFPFTPWFGGILVYLLNPSWFMNSQMRPIQV